MFRLSYNANQHVPKGVWSAEDRELWYKQIAENLSEYELRLIQHLDAVAEQKRVRKIQDDLHAHYCKLAGNDPRYTMSVAQAKNYVRARAGDKLRDAFEFLEDALTGRVAVNLKDRIDIAYEVIKRAAGNHTVMNAVPNVKALTELAPVDAIDKVMTAYGDGLVDEKFVNTLLGLLGAKVNGLRVEEGLSKKSAAKTGDKITKPPSGKVV